MRRLPLVLLVALAGCGSSSAGVIDAHNAKELRLFGPSQGPLSGAPQATDSNGRLELVAPNGKWKLSAGTRSVRFVDATTGRTLDTLASPLATATAVAWSRDSRSFAVGGYRGGVSVWNEFEQRTYDLPVGRATVAALAFSPDGRLLVTAQSPGGLRVWELSERKAVARLAPGIAVSALLFSDDGQRILAGSESERWQLRLPR